MWLNKRHYYGLFLVGLLVSQEVNGKYPGLDGYPLTVLGTFTVPTCTLKMPDRVILGSLKTGISTHHPVKIEIECPDGTSIKTGLYAMNVTGMLDGSNNDKMTMVSSSGNTTTGKPAFFWLMDNDGNNIKLDGSQNNVFCQGVSVSRVCTLTPYTQVFVNTTREQVEAVVRFNVAYP